MLNRSSLIALLGLLFLGLIPVQTATSQTVTAIKTQGEIQIDGLLDDSEWQNAEPISDFTQFEPKNGEPATHQTYIRVMFDDEHIYFGIECQDPEPERISTRITKRDGEVWEDDAVALVIDSYDDNNNAYFFVVNALGTQQDERWADNGRTRDTKWDVQWQSGASINEQGWTAEIAIPLSSIRYNRNTTQWGLNVLRYIPRHLEQSHWVSGLSEWFRIAEIGTIEGLDLSGSKSKVITFIPYTQVQFEKGEKVKLDAGAELKVNLSSNFSVNATVNPDFATIEGDVEQVNLTRFELSYPEKRPFFMEGAENYSTRIKQFYSRRVGEIPWGVKLNGKIDKWKINTLATQSDPSSVNTAINPGDKALFNVFRITRDLPNASNIGLIGANRLYKGQNKGSIGLVSTLFFTRYLGMTSQLIKSYGEYNTGDWTYFIRPAFDSKTGHFHVRYTHVGENVMENMNEIGMIRDDNRRELDSNIKKQFWINRYGFEEITPMINYNMYWGMSGILRSWDVTSELEVSFFKKWNLELDWEEEFKRFEKDFRNRDITVDLSFDNKRGHSVSAEVGGGHNYDRDLLHAGLGINLKILEGWNLTYHINGYWFDPDNEDDNAVIHYIRSTYYLNKDLFFKLFYQSRYDVTERFLNPDFDLDRQTVQFVFVWRFLPPFGSIQLAYQQGTTRVTDIEGQGQTLLAKFSWVF